MFYAFPTGKVNAHIKHVQVMTSLYVQVVHVSKSKCSGLNNQLPTASYSSLCDISEMSLVFVFWEGQPIRRTIKGKGKDGELKQDLA